MPRKPTSENAQELDERLKREALRALDKRRAEEDAVDAMVKRSISQYGP